MTEFSLKYFKMRINSFIQRLDLYFQLLIISRSWVRHIDTNFDDVIIVKVTMRRSKFEKMVYREIFLYGGDEILMNSTQYADLANVLIFLFTQYYVKLNLKFSPNCSKIFGHSHNRTNNVFRKYNYNLCLHQCH